MNMTFERGSLKRARTHVYIDFTLNVASQQEPNQSKLNLANTNTIKENPQTQFPT